MQISFDKIASEDFSVFMQMSKLLKNPNNIKEKTAAGAPQDDKKEKAQIAEKTVAFSRVTVFLKIIILKNQTHQLSLYFSPVI